ncbi:Wadjet anti-phage system protein JetD domain-containing protein [Ruminococcus sp.]
MDHRKRILNDLLDKYEKSTQTEFKRRIMIDCTRSNYLDITDPEQKKQFLNAVTELSEKELIFYDWERKGYVVKNVWLNTDKADEAYAFIGRKSTYSAANELAALFGEYLERINTAWIADYLSRQISEITERSKPIEKWQSDMMLVRNILKALDEIDRLISSISMRAFSIRLFADSKFFEKNIKKYIVDIASKNEPELEAMDELSEREILAQIGIIMMPEIFEFCGDMTIGFADGEVDYSPIRSGSCITSDSVKDIRYITLDSRISKILFIENKTNYSQYCLNSKLSDELVIYHGGFYSPAHGVFFRFIADAAKKNDIPVFFWADIDYGGFRMFIRLRDNIIPALKPLNMDTEAFSSHSEKLLGRNDKYIHKTLELLTDPDYECFYDVINMIAKRKGTVEQECFLLDDNPVLV